MKKSLLLISLSLWASIAFCQAHITELERVEGLWTMKGEAKPYTGDFQETFEDGRIKGTGTLVDGQLEGLRIQYFPNGNKRTEYMYKGGYPHGTAKEYDENGTLRQIGDFVNKKESGAWIIYYPSGEKHVESTFIDGVQQGKYSEYAENGKLLVQYYFIDGQARYSPEFMEYSSQALQLSRDFKNEDAIKLYDKAIEINPTVAQAYFNRGVCKGNIFDFEGAIADYDIAIDLNPKYMEAYGNRGSAKINMYTSKGTLTLSPEQAASACEDFYTAKDLGDTSIGTEDMIYLYCKKNKPKKKRE